MAEKAKKDLKAIEFQAALMAHMAAALFEGATVDADKRTAETEDLIASVGVVRSEEVPFDQETLIFGAKTSAGVQALCGIADFRTEKETPEQTHTGLFNYALGLRIRGDVSRRMKAAAAGPEKAMATALKSLEALVAAGVLTAEQVAEVKGKMAKAA